MVNKLYGKKLGMTRLFLGEGESFPATVLKIEPCVVVQMKTDAKDGYNALQVGFGLKTKKQSKPILGHLKASGKGPFAHLKEIKVDDPSIFELGQEISADVFKPGDIVNVVGQSKGKGFCGVIKRWGFGGGRETHGSRCHRIPGSIGRCATPGRVDKGQKMPGHHGNKKVTVKNLSVIDVRPEFGVLILKGAVPGAKDGIIEISKN